MKKILALVLCLMLALSMTAFAETTVTSMNITLSEIELNVGEAYALNPAVSFSFGVDGEAFWAEVAAQLEGANVLALQIEGMSDDTAYVSVDGANDVLKVANVSELANTQGVDLVGTIESLKESFMQMGDAAAIEAQLDSLASMDQEGLTVEKLGELDYKVAYTEAESGLSVSLRMTIALGKDKPFDLLSKNAVEISADMTALPENDVITVAQEKLGVLMADESVAALVTLISAFTGASSANAA